METSFAVRGFGRVEVESCLRRHRGFVVLNDFLRSLTKRFLIRSRNYWNEADELPYVYRERQLHSVLCPAIADITPYFLAEAPMKRRYSDSNGERTQSQGWVDYFCHYRDVSVFLEVKHGFHSARKPVVRKYVDRYWRAAAKQQGSIGRHMRHWIEGKGGVRVSLLFLPFYASSKDGEVDRTITDDYLRDRDCEVFAQLKPSPNWSALCICHKDVSGPYDYDNGWEEYPALAIYGKARRLRPR